MESIREPSVLIPPTEPQGQLKPRTSKSVSVFLPVAMFSATDVRIPTPFMTP